MGIISYAQNFEDVILWRALGRIENGFYIDIGAQHPFVDSVSRAFYEKGWRGISVEATPAYANLLRDDRPDELIIQAAVSKRSGVLQFYEIPNTGISTGDLSIADEHRKRGFIVQELVVPCITLENIFSQTKNKEIHWLKIDVEGMEQDVLESWGNYPARPWVIVVESTIPLTEVESYENWEELLFERGYTFVYFDGLNRFYVSSEHLDITHYFKTPPNVFDDFVLNGTASASFCQLLNEKEQVSSEQYNNELIKQKEELTKQAAEHQEELVQMRLSMIAFQSDYAAVIENTQRELQTNSIEFAGKEHDYLMKLANLERKLTKVQADAIERERKLQAQHSNAAGAAQRVVQARLTDFTEKERNYLTQLANLQSDLGKAQTELMVCAEVVNQERGKITFLKTLLLEQTLLHHNSTNFIWDSWGKKRKYSQSIFFLEPEYQALVYPEYTTLKNSESATMMNSPTTIESLLALPDEVFVTQSYRIILNRDPDPEGLRYYCNRLRLGFAKEQVLMQLKQSIEAQGKKCELDGLEKTIARYRVGRRPVIGWFYRWIHGDAGCRRLNKHLLAVEHQVQALHALIEKQNQQLLINVKEGILPTGIQAESIASKLQTLSPAAHNIYTELKSLIKQQGRK